MRSISLLPVQGRGMLLWHRGDICPGRTWEGIRQVLICKWIASRLTGVRGVQALTITIIALLKGVTVGRAGVRGVGVWPGRGVRGLSRNCSIMGRRRSK